MHDVEACGPGAEVTQHRVHVGAVHVGERPGRMDGLEELDDVRLEEPERRGVREHDRGAARAQGGAQRIEVHAAVGARGHRDGPVAGHRGGRRVRAVRRIRDEDLVPLGVAARLVVGPDDEDAGQLAVGAGGWLQRDGGEAADLGQLALQPPQQLQRPLRQRVGCQRMEGREARAAGPPTR